MEWIGARRLTRLLTVIEAADAIEGLLPDRTPPVGDPLRTHVELARGELLTMPAERGDYGGVKLVTLSRDSGSRRRIGGVFLLWESSSLRPLALVDGAALTALRTPALSVVATRRLARADAHRLVVFGAGPQAFGHAMAMAAIRPITDVGVVGRDPVGAARLVASLRRRGLPAHTGGDVATADVVCTCTSASTPLFDGARLADHAHVNAIGAHTPTTREIDGTTLRRAVVVVEDRRAALAEAGDVTLAIAEGALRADDLRYDLAELVGAHPPEPDPTLAEHLTVFKSVGIAAADLAVALAAWRRTEAATRRTQSTGGPERPGTDAIHPPGPGPERRTRAEQASRAGSAGVEVGDDAEGGWG